MSRDEVLDLLALLFEWGSEHFEYLELKSGGERGIRTLDRVLTYTPLAGERLQPLGHLSK